MLALDRVTRRFGETIAVSDLTLQVERGSFVGVVGRSGAGKSTLLRMVNRLVEPTSGTIRFDGVEVTALKGKALRRWRSRAAMIFQQFNLVGRLDVLTNVLIGRLFATPTWRALLKLWSEDDKVIALSALEQFGVAELAGRRADQLSGGQQQRVAIVRALVQEPDIILADEPIASLDPRNSGVVMDALLQVNRQFGITIVCSLHSLDMARTYCDRLIGMSEGRVVFDGLPESLTDEVARELYGIEAAEAVDAAVEAMPDLADTISSAAIVA